MTTENLDRRLAGLDEGDLRHTRDPRQMTDARLQAAIEKELAKNDPSLTARYSVGCVDERDAIENQILAGGGEVPAIERDAQMRSIDGRVTRLEATSGATSQVFVLQIGDQTFESAVANWMARNPGQGDPRDWAEITVLHVEMAPSLPKREDD